MMRRLLPLVLACHGQPAPIPPPPVPDAAEVKLEPPARLPLDVTPLAYDLALDVDPDRPSFTGTVAIDVELPATDHVWLHAANLKIDRATIDGAPMKPLAGADQMIGFRFAKRAAGKAKLEFDYAGDILGDEQGLFRQQVDQRWYLFAQSESVFARRIVPCFDEPAFKATWKVTLTVPGDAVALANAPQASEAALADGHRKVTFAETPPMASYLLAIAVGPFEIVDAGTIGKNKVPLRAIVFAGERDHAGVVAAWTAKMTAGLESYFDEPIPLAKLDIVTVPRFFGAMENPGLVTVQAQIALGDPANKPFADHYVRIMAHELAHQWLGDDVTFAWWDDLWLSEAFATWLGDQLVASLKAFDDTALRVALDRERALRADAEPDARPLRRAVDRGDDPEAGFDAIAYEKGGAVLAMFERTIGEARMRDAVRAYVRGHRHATATTQDLLAAIGQSTPEARALASYIDHAGTPVVDMTLRCEGAPELDVAVRTNVIVPVCVRYLGSVGPAGTCALVDGKAQLPLREAKGCPSWVTGNADGAGYYEVVWDSVGNATPPVSAQTPAERLAYGADIGAAVARGDIAVTAGLAELNRLAASHDTYAALAAATIARDIEPFIDDATAPRWWDYLAGRFADQLTAAAVLDPTTPAARELRDTLVELIPADHLPAATTKRARREIDALLSPTGGKPIRVIDHDRFVLLATVSNGGGKLFDSLATAAIATTDVELRALFVEAIGELDQVDRAFGFVLDGKLATAIAWPAIRGTLDRPATRTAAWIALAKNLPQLIASITPADAQDAIRAAVGICDPTLRASVAAAFEPHVADIPDARRTLDHSLAVIDRCISRRSRAGELANALRKP